MSKTKVTGVLLFLIAVLKTAVDVVDGGGFSLSAHALDAQAALGGLGFVFLRDAIGKVQKSLK